MQRTFLKSKIHRATVTDANLNYEGSLTIDVALIEQAGMQVFELVSVVNINNGERFETYIIEGARDSGEICLNGAAARKAQIGDKLIIMTYCSLNEEEVLAHKPTIIFVNDSNKMQNKTNQIDSKTHVK